MAHLAQCPVSTVEDHLEGDVGPILDTGDPRGSRHQVDASGRAVSLEITNDKLVCTRSRVKVAKGRRRRRGGEYHTNWERVGQNIRGSWERNGKDGLPDQEGWEVSQRIKPFVSGNLVLFEGCVYPSGTSRRVQPALVNGEHS